MKRDILSIVCAVGMSVPLVAMAQLVEPGVGSVPVGPDAGQPSVSAPALPPAPTMGTGSAPVPVPAAPVTTGWAKVVSVSPVSMPAAASGLAYQVVYEFGGQAYSAVLPFHPGALLQVQMVSPTEVPLAPPVSGSPAVAPVVVTAVPVPVPVIPAHLVGVAVPAVATATWVVGVGPRWRHGPHWRHGGWRGHRHW